MADIGKKNPAAKLEDLGIKAANAYWNLPPEELTKKTVDLGQGTITDMGALAVNTGKFTGRSPKDKFTVKDCITENTVDWGDINFAISPENFNKLYNGIVSYYKGKDIWVRDSYACADPKHRLNIRVVNDTPWANLFCNDLFLRPTSAEVDSANPDWLILQAPGYLASHTEHGTRQENFTVVNFTKKIILDRKSVV